MKIVLLLLLSLILWTEQSIVQAKVYNLKLWGKKFWVDVPLVKEMPVNILEKEYGDLSDEEKALYVSRVVSMRPSESKKHVWTMGKKWLQKQVTESTKSLVDDAKEITDAKIPSDRAYAVIHFAVQHKIVTMAGVAGVYYLSRALLGPSASEYVTMFEFYLFDLM